MRITVLSALAAALLAALGAPRCAAQGPVITEFLADPEGSILDSDGEESDWIEVQNRGAGAVDLLGWGLTDDPRVPLQWRFPKVVLQPGAYLIVFASGKNRAVAGAELHANFKLSPSGEYLALVEPDGRTIASEFAPYPPQRAGFSFGIGRRTSEPPLAGPGSPARFLVPAGGGLGLSWTGGSPFDDSPWSPATLGIGYPGGGGTAAPLPLAYYPFDGDARDAAEGGRHGELRGDASFSTDVPAALGGGRSLRLDGADDFLSASLDVSEGPYTLSLWFKAESGSRGIFAVVGGDLGANGHDRHLYLTGGNIASRVWNDETIASSGRSFADRQWHHAAHVVGGWAAGQRIYVDGVLVASGSKAASDFNWQERVNIGFSNDAGAPYFQGSIDDVSIWDDALTEAQVRALASGAHPLAISGFGPWVATDVGAALRGVSASAYVRIPFDLPSVGFDALALRVRYDDGFIAHLNGIEVARRNAPEAPAYDSRASSDRPLGAAVRIEEIDLGPSIGILRPGGNLLAFHALNDRPDGSDFLLEPELAAGWDLDARYLAPTPGGPNGEGVGGFVEDTVFSADRGFYDAPFDVEIATATEGAAIHYTTDGSVPVPGNPGTLLYAAPVRISKTTVLRAAAFEDDLQPTNVDTQTYIFPDGVALQSASPAGLPATWAGGYPADYGVDPDVVNRTIAGYGFREALLDLPTLSLATSPADLFSLASGVYSNSQGRGPGWERAASIELIRHDGVPGFQAECGIRMHGNSSRDHGFTPKHPIRLYFRSEYGQKKLEYKLFEDSKVSKFDELLLRGCSTDSWPVVDGGYVLGVQRWAAIHAAYFRDQYMRDAQIEMGRPSCHGTYVHLFLDGLYWGVYNLAERPVESFCANHMGGEKEEYDIFKDFAELEAGNYDAWNAAVALASAGLGSEASYQRIQGRNPDGTRNEAYPVYLDVDDLIDYMVLHIASGAEDWPHHNWWGARRRGTESEGFRFFSWDQEISNDSLIRTHTLFETPFEQPAPNASPSWFSGQCAASASYRRAFGDRVEKHLRGDGLLTAARSAERWLRRQRELDRAIVGESARWGDSKRTVPYKREVEWLAEMDWMRDHYWPEIGPIALERFRRVGLYPEVDAPRFEIGGLERYGGTIVPGDLLAMRVETVTGRVERSLVAADSPAAALVPADGTLGDAWRRLDFVEGAAGETWKRGENGVGYEASTGYAPAIRIDMRTEMMGVTTSAYVRIPFTVDDPAAISGLKLRMLFDDGFVAYLNGARVAATNAPEDGSIAWDSEATGSVEADLANPVEIDLDGSRGLLRAGANLLALQGLNLSRDSTDFLVLPELVALLEETEVPAADVFFTLDRKDPMDPAALSYAAPVRLEGTTVVKARAREDGQWSALVEAIFTDPLELPLRVSEIAYRPAPWENGGDPDEYEFLEIVNAGGRTMSLAGVRIEGGVAFDLGATGWSLGPGARILVVEDLEAFEARYGTTGKLVAGRYSGKLSNEGERIVLRGPLGEVLLDFRYDATWFPETAGGGRSLVIADEGAPPESWGLQGSWKPSAWEDGSPGEPEPDAGGGGRRVPGDSNGDAVLDLADAVSLLFHLFGGEPIDPPCFGALDEGGNLALLDSNADGGLDISDAAYVLGYLFAGGQPPALGTACVKIPGCPPSCR